MRLNNTRALIVGALVAVALLGGAAFAFFSNISPASACEAMTNDAEKKQCWEREIIDMVRTEGVYSAFALLTHLYETEPVFAPDCHAYVHLIGEESYGRFIAGTLGELAPEVSYCGYGFFHGFMETLLFTTGNIEEARDFCDYVDAHVPPATGGATNACFHGIGHGTTDGSNPNTWGDADKMAAPGLLLCERVKSNTLEQYLCVSGVYNALEILSQDERYNLTELAQDPYAFCRRQSEAYREACYTNMLIAVLHLTDDDVEATATYVETRLGEDALLPAVIGTTEEYVILSLATEFVRLNLDSPARNQEALSFCRKRATEATRLSCIEGIALGHMKYGPPKRAHTDFLAFCGMPGLPHEEKNGCYGHVLKRLSLWYTKEEASGICKEVPERYKTHCML